MELIRTLCIVLVVFGFSVSAQSSQKCDFEKGLCKFLSNDRGNRESWRVAKGKVKSGETGPSIDHTLGTANGSYIYVDVSRARTYPVRLVTTVLTTDYCLRFFYHMYGADIGQLTVTAESVFSYNAVQYFIRSGTQGDRWKEARFTITRTQSMKTRGYKIIFEAKGKSNSAVWGDIALDDIELTPRKCADTRKDAYDLCSFDNYDCGYSASRNGYISWNWHTPERSQTDFNKKPKRDHTLGTPNGGYWYIGEEGYTDNKVQTATLSSPVYKKPKTSLNCLHFYVYLDHDGSHFWYGGVKENFIQVFLNFPESKQSRKWIATKAKNTTEHAVWTYVEAKAEITESFQIQFIAGLQTPTETIAVLDDVKLLAGNCPEAGFCDFEQNKCSWTDGEGDYTWILRQPSSWTNNEIGPDTDHTLGTSAGSYIVFNTRNKVAGQTAKLQSEFFPPSKDTYCVSFFYYMAGNDLGTLKVIVETENITESSIWILKGPQGEAWKQGKVLMKSSKLMYTRVVFHGITGSGKNAYMALDDVRIRKGEKCDLTPVTADPRNDAMEKLSCTFDDLNLCRWKQDSTSLNWKFGNGTQYESTGPKEPLNGKGHYLFISSYEGTQSNNEKKARLISPVISSFYPDAACFSMYYHMFGAHVGELRVILVQMQNSKEETGREVIWRRKGTQPDKWMQLKDSLNVTAGDYRIEIEAEGGPGFAGDIAIDDILLSLGACPSIDMCDFESSLCGWKIEGSMNDTYYWERGVKMDKGPPSDHTTQTDAGYYLQAVAEEDAQLEDQTYLVSPKFNERWGPHCLTFWYWRPGYQSGKLGVFTRFSKKQESVQWQAEADVGQIWHYGQVTIDEKKKSFQIVIQAEKGLRNDYHIAIDDILIKNSVCGQPAECNFNNDYCSYFNNGTSDFPWLLGAGRVVNSQLVDHPPSDNTVENGMYVYADMTSPSLQPYQSAVLVSEILEGTGTQVACVSFNFYIGGEDNSTLSVGKMVLDNRKENMEYNISEVFRFSDSTANKWKTWNQNIAVKKGEGFQVYYKATKGEGSRAFIAIDDVTATDGECSRPTTEPPVTVTEMPETKLSCDFDEGNLCSWEAEKKSLKWTINVPYKGQEKMPKFDHTQGNFNGRYVYLKGDDVSTKEGSLINRYADASWNGNFCVGFWYFMNVEGGSNSLKFQAEYSEWFRDSFINFWERKGNLGNVWRHAYVHVKTNMKRLKVRILGSVLTGIIALDDVQAKGGSCPPTKMCTFDDDDDMCSYTQDSKNILDWDVKSGEDNGTLVKIADHTTQSITGKYLYIGFDGKSTAKSQRSRIYSPKRPASVAASCVSFYYHIYNVSKLTLNTYVSTDNGVSDPQWSVSVGQALLWHGARFTVSSKLLSWQIVYEVEVGNGGYGQVAIDDITVVNRPCDDPGACDFEDEDCLWENVRRPIGVTDPVKLRAVSADVPTDLLKDDFDWTRQIGEEYFGPPRDHTLGSPQGFYLLLDPRNQQFGKKAVYMSERLRAPTGICFKLWYVIPNYPNGATLQVFVTSDFKTAEPIKLIKDPTNEKWTEALVSVIPSTPIDSAFNDFWIFLSGKSGNHTMSYVAIDDLSITEGICEEKTELFDCKNGETVLSTDVCNFKKDCGNGLDEASCADCDFESGLCGWTAEKYYDYFKWTRQQARTRDLALDHTKGDNSGYYVLAYQAWSYGNDRAELKSADLRNAFSTCSIEFYYHLRPQMEFKVTLERSNKSIDVWIPESRSEDVWVKGQLFLGRIAKTFKVIFVAVRDKTTVSKVAIDDITMTGCETPTTGEPGSCTSEQFDCKNSRCIPKDNICDYTDDCGNFEDERKDMCVAAISRCSFDQSFCNWIQDNQSGGIWQLRGPFTSLDQGPTRDHTSGFSNGKFLYLAGRAKLAPARLFGPMLQPAENCQIRLYYDIRGTGNFYLQVKIRTESNGEEKVVWSRQDPTEGYFFIEDKYTFNETKPFQVILEAAMTIGEGKINYIALDDISFNHKCVPQIAPLPTVPPDLTTPTPPKKRCQFNEFSCSSLDQCIPNSQKCDFKEDCVDGSDEHQCGACDFHEDMCGLENLASWSRYKWQRANAEMFAYSKNSTAPDKDSYGHKEGYFALLTGKQLSSFSAAAVLRTPVLGAMAHSCKLEFFYHYNIRGGSLEVWVAKYRWGPKQQMFKVSKNTGKEWQFASVPLGNYAAGAQIEFQGNTDYSVLAGKVQDMAIDHINYVNCDPSATYNKTSINCTFDIDECGWHPDINVKSAVWTRAKRAPAGPESDHTGREGYLMYISAGTRLKKGDKAHLVSLRQAETSASCFSFWYHMYGQDVGTLNIIVRNDNENRTIWRKTGSQGFSWRQGTRTIRSNVTYSVIIEGIVGSFSRPVIAIDDTLITDGECPHPVACEFEADFCEWSEVGWVLQQGKGNTPSADHTTDTGEGRYAALIEETGKITSPEYNYTKSEYCLNFWYFLEGSRDTLMRIQREEEPPTGKPVSFWSESAEPDTKGMWRHARVNVDGLDKGDYHVAIYGEKKPGSYVALDDMAIEEEACPNYGSCDFEKDFCTWINLPKPISSGLKWIRHSGKIVDYYSGPEVDHTTGSADGWYIYMDAGYGFSGEKAVLESENLHYSPEACFRLWYYMYGYGQGTLEVSYVDLNTSKIYSVASISGNMGNNWYSLKKLVKKLPQVYRVRLTGIKGWSGYLALDDLSFQMDTCDEPTITTPSPTEFPPTSWDCDFERGDFCGWEQGDAWTVRQGRKALDLSQGPYMDHTKGNALGYYAYYNPVNDSGHEVTSETIDTGTSDYCFRFWYYMHSTAPTSLEIHVLQYNNLAGPLWVKKTSAGTKWKYGTYFLEKSVNMSIVFKAKREKQGVGDIALDDISLNKGQCPIVKGQPCEFESADICGFKTTTNDGITWQRVQAKNIKGGQIGPKFDKTYGTNEGHFMMIKPSPNGRVAGDNKAWLTMPNVPKTGIFRSCVQFWYQMAGDNVISLQLYMKPSTGPLPQFSLWSHGSKHGNDTWRIGQRTIDAPYVHDIVFEAVMERGSSGFIALDDVVVKDGACPPPGSCDFESDLCTWQNAESGVDLEWVRNTGSTPTKKTGPKVDHTLGTAQGSYVYLQGSNPDNKRNLVGILQSEFFSISTERCLSFWAHMRGSEMGTLMVNVTYYSDDDRLQSWNDKKWNFKGDQGKKWFNKRITIKNDGKQMLDEYQISFVGITGGNLSDIALDDIEVSNGICYEVPDDAFDCRDGKHINASKVCDFEKDCAGGDDEVNCGACDFEHDSCGWSDLSMSSSSLKWERVPGQNATSTYGLGYDHTFRSPTGYFMFVRNPNYYSWQVPVLKSPDIKFKKSYASCSMVFYYAFKENTKHYLRLKKVLGAYTLGTVWERYGSLDDGWQKGTAYLGTSERPFTLEFYVDFKYGISYVVLDDITFENCNMPAERDSCTNKEFKCSNNRCVSRYFLCDQTDDCGDGSDEDDSICSSYPKPCTFEGYGDCEWETKGKAKDKWQVVSSYSSRGESNTGPLVDHTTGLNSNSKFLSLRRYYSDNKNNESYLFSPNYILNSSASYCSIRFYYYLHGSEDAYIKLYTETEKDGWSWKQRLAIYGSLGQKWNRALFSVRSKKAFHFIIGGNPGFKAYDRIAIDDISLTNGCARYADELPTPETTPLPTRSPCTNEETKCEAGQPLCIPKEKKCDFTLDCSDGSDEKGCGPCDFEENMCGWKDESSGYYDWTRKNASENNGFGPPTDSRNSTTGSYAYVQEFSGFYTYGAVLVSPNLPPTSSHCVMAFWLYVSRSSAGNFYVEHRSPSYFYTEFNKIWTLPSIFKSEWQRVEVKIPASTRKGTTVRFFSSPNWYTFTKEKNVAVDDISFLNCNPKQLVVDCNFDDDNFNGGLCHWTEASNNYIGLKWKRGKGSTERNFTGPTSDHTTGHGYYMYIESLYSSAYYSARLDSPTLPMNLPDGNCFSFWYHMYGQHVGTLSVQARRNYFYQRHFVKSRSQGNKWHFAEIFILSNYDHMISFLATTEWGKEHNIAIDDIKMIDGPCHQTHVCDFEMDFCGWNATQVGLSGWTRETGSGNWSDKRPMIDHTTNSEFGHFINMPFKRRGDLARLASPLYKNYGDVCVKFWYNMFGNDIGTLAVYQRTNQEGRLENNKHLWKRSGDHVGVWKLGRTTMNSLPSFYIAFEAQTGIGPMGHIALDDIEITHGKCSDPASCTFELDTCGWSNSAAYADFDWVRRTGSDNNIGGGPTGDHTTGTIQGHYMYALLTGSKENAKSTLLSEDLDISPNYCLSFWYNMYNAVNISLLIEQEQIGGEWEDVNEIRADSVVSGVWEKIENNLTVLDAGNFFQLGLTAIARSSLDNETYRGIAVDDLSLTKTYCGEEITTTVAPPITTPQYPPTKYDCTFERDFCLWENDPKLKNTKWDRVTGHSNKKLTRPRTDHSSLSSSGYYLTLSEAAKYDYYSKARLLTMDGIDTSQDGICFKFWYHMYGNNPGALYLKTRNFHEEEKFETVWTRSKSQGPDWKYDQVFIKKDYAFNLVFEGDGTRYGDISLDDFSLNFKNCPPRDFCDVEQDFCEYSLDPESDFNWARGAAYSISKGPDVDHTLGTRYGYYFYVNPLEKVSLGQVARLDTTNIQPDKQCIQFWYYLNGKDVGTLEVLVKNGDTEVSKWKETGDDNEFWHGSQVVLDKRFATAYNFIFQVTVGTAFENGSIAIDDIAIKTECPPLGSCNFEDGMCLWFNDPTVDLQWIRGTGEISDVAPENDTTLGNQFGTYLYAHVVNTWKSNPEPARIISPYFSSNQKRCVNYWNFRNGTDFNGALRLWVYVAATNNLSDIQHFTIEKLGRWNNEQKQVTVEDTGVDGKYQIIFTAELTSSLNQFIALDDINIYEGDCEPIEDRKPDFVCDEGKTHISDDYRCDFYNDCKDGADENSCGTHCDFETLEPYPCNWNSSSNRGSWKQTLANKTDEPYIDHTKQNPDDGYYMKITLDKYIYFADVHLKSPALIQSAPTCRMFFWYYFTTLRSNEALFVYYESGHVSKRTELFRLEGGKQRAWVKGEVVVGRINHRFQIVIAGEKKAATSIFAIDDIDFENCDIPRKLDKPQKCNDQEYQCGNGNCISKKLLCDFVDDCGDYTDENRVIAKCEQYPGRCDFEGSNFCDWSKGAETDFAWTIKQFSNSYYASALAPRDHTKNAATGKYLYFSNSYRTRGEVARLASKVMETTGKNCNIRFFYTYGTVFNSTKYDEVRDTGVLSVYIRRDEINIWKTLFSTREPPGQYYEKVILPLDQFKDRFEVIIESRIGGTSKDGGWAVDDVSFTPGCIVSKNQSLPLSIDEPTEPPVKDCKAKEFLCVVDERCITLEQVCDFVPDCSDSADENKCGSCTFDDDSNPTCGWFDVVGNRWRRAKGPRGSNGLTKDISGAGYYMYVNKENSGSVSSSANFRSVDFKYAAASCEISFYYFMSGITSSDASLKLQIQTRDKKDVLLWREASDQGQHWNNVTVGIGRRLSGWHLDFITTHVLSAGDIAIDEINFLRCAPPEKRKCANKEEFACLSGECINGSLVCDFNLDCPDGSDEFNCSDYLERCDFEKDLCSWVQDSNPYLKWNRTSGKKQPEGFIPDRDHTINDDNGHFLMVKKGSGYYWNTLPYARVVSTAFTADTSGNCKLRFWYHLYLPLTSKITISMQYQDDSRFRPFMVFNGTNDEEWKRAEVVLKSKFNFHIAIEGTPASGDKGNVAIDDTSFTLECVPVYTIVTTPIPTIQPKGVCDRKGEFACEDNTCVPMDFVCDFKVDCINGLDEKNCPAFCDFELGSTCGWQALTNDGDGIDINVTIAQDAYRSVWGAPRTDKTTGTGQGSYLLMVSTVESEVGPIDEYQSPLFHSSAATCKFSFWVNARTYTMDPKVIIATDKDSFEILGLKSLSRSTWNKVEIGIGRQKGNFTVKFSKKGGTKEWDFIAIDDIEFVNCALPKSDPEICPGHRCKITRACIEEARVCDLTDDCGDGTDEQDCGSKNYFFTDFEDGGFGVFKIAPDSRRAPLVWEIGSGTSQNYFTQGTGPPFDHTLSNTGGKYIYMTKRFEGGMNEKAWAFSDVIRSIAKGECQMRFYYFMYGHDVNQLNIYTISQRGGSFNRLWSQSGAVGNFWMRGVVFLNDSNPFQVILEGKSGLNTADVIALDDISFTTGCKLLSSETLPPKEVTGTYPITTSPEETTCTTNEFTCKSDKSCIPAYKKCDFRGDCPDSSDEEGCVKPYCDFENKEMCGWQVTHKFIQNSRRKRDVEDDHAYQWINIQAKDNSPKINTKFRPRVDHTLNTSEGWYLMADGAPGIEDDVTSLISPQISATHALCSLDFWIYRGTSYSQLKVYAGKEGTQKPLWNQYDDLPGYWGVRGWEHARIPLGALTNTVVRFDAIRPKSPNSVTCLDDIKFNECAPPEEVDPEEGRCDGGQFQCKNDKCIADNLLCDFNDDCTDYSDERDFVCQPYAGRCNFEGAPCPNWHFENDYNAKWAILSPGTSKYAGIPKTDHTTKTSNGKFLSVAGQYSYRELKPKIRSDAIDGYSTDCKIRFWYNTINYNFKINVYKRVNYGKDGMEFIDAVSSDVNNYWHRAELAIINNKQEDFQIVLEAALEYRLGSVNFDDISLTPGCHFTIDHRDIPGKPTVQPEIDDCYPKLSCDDGGCYSQTQKCNFINDCEDGTDEVNCGTSCDFENKTCGWFNPKGYIAKWALKQGKNNYWGSLSRDHTTNSTEGYFLSVTDIRNVKDVAQLHTQTYVISGSNCKMTLWYYLDQTVGASISILLLHDTKNNKYEELWKVTTEAEEWKQVEVKIGLQHDFAVIVQSTMGMSSLYASIAIDDIEFTTCSPEHPPTTCLDDEWMCSNKEQCIKVWQHCDGQLNCKDKSDEYDCKSRHGDCDFDNDNWETKCKWESKQMGADWLRAKQGRSNETGPERNRNPTKEGYFLYLDSSQVDEGRKAGVMTPYFNASDGKCHLRFWYFMKGSPSLGTLEVRSEGENGHTIPVWIRRGPQGEKWLFAHSLVGNDQKYRVAFVATRGGDDKTDIAIDDVSFTEGCEEGGTAIVPTGEPVGQCRKNEFRCEDGSQCIPEAFLCDCAPECQDGSDEKRCKNTCATTLPPKEWTTFSATTPVFPSSILPQGHCNSTDKLCGDGQTCIPHLLVCDGVRDCPDGSDEQDGCGKALLCQEKYYFCNDLLDHPCIHRDHICDDHVDCQDGADESLCGRCPPEFCKNGGTCKVVKNVPVCECPDGFAQNRCAKKRITEKPKDDPTIRGAGIGWIIGVVIGTLLLIAILFIIWFKRNTNAERLRLSHAVDNPVYGLNLETLTFGELNSHMPVRNEDGLGATAIENPLYSFKSEIK